MDEIGEYRLEDQVGFLLRKANQRHRAIFARLVDPPLAPMQFAALATLAEHGPLSQNLLGRLAAMDSATIFGVVRRLREAGLVSVRNNPDDSRQTIVDLTTEGWDTVSVAIPSAIRVTDATLEGLDDRRRARAVDLLTRLSETEAQRA